MKKIVTLMIMAMFSTSLFAQIALVNFDVQEQPYEVYENGAVIECHGKPDVMFLEAHLGVWNQGAAADVVVNRTDLNIVDGSSNYFCWGMCYSAAVYTSQPYPMDEESVDFYGFSAHYEMRDAEFNPIDLPLGTSTVRYSFYDAAQPQDSAWVIVKYIVSETAIAEQSELTSTVYPNPAQNQLFIETNTTENATIALYNMAGQKVKEVAVSSSRTRVDVADLPNGAYLYAIIVDGKNVSGKRVVIAR